MARLTREWIDAQRKRAENTHVVETKNGVIVIAHPGQKPETDPKLLREQFGVLPGFPVVRLADTDHAPPIAKWEHELELQNLPREDQIAYHRQELARLEAEARAERGGIAGPLFGPEGDPGPEAGSRPGGGEQRTPRRPAPKE